MIKSRAYFSFGSSLHRALELFAKSGDEGVPVQAQLRALYEDSWVSAGYESADQMAEAFGEGVGILAAAAEEQVFVPTGGRILAAEKPLRLDLGEFVLIGRIDRLDEHPDGTLEILDFKSGRKAPTQIEADEDIALGCYQLMVRHHYPDRPLKASLIGLRETTRVTTSMTDDQLDEFRFALVELGHKILCHEWFEMEPVQKPLCATCDFVSLCARYTAERGESL